VNHDMNRRFHPVFYWNGSASRTPSNWTDPVIVPIVRRFGVFHSYCHILGVLGLFLMSVTANVFESFPNNDADGRHLC